ncbi:LysR family transcriptional regulator [Azospirillum sp. TSA2s]|uniref:LysR family transcriptional regulator n=1 Tax=Azospirillum sp. TSA2s TaxID=709810 RepID=UPI0010AA5D52|nr:LysR family transcriptional regulator [Azospirillum sp. TSA2s]QCG94407.1 LysR family transcriptional regulator [Azospirillum sp. TSA2s]
MLDALTLDQMRIFVTVVEAGSFRAAAVRLSRVQSAVSHAVANLEAELGLTLFDRSGHRPVLTPGGRALLADARAILLKVDALRARARGMCEGVELSLSIAVDCLFPLAAVGAALKELHDAYPAVGVEVVVGPLGVPFSALYEGKATVGIVVGGDLRDPRIELEALSSLSFVAVVAAAHPLAARSRTGDEVTATELTDHLQIVQADPTPLSEGRDFGVLSPGTWRVSGQDTKQALILAGAGWGRLPRWAVERDLAEGRLVRVRASALGRDGEAVVDAFLAHRNDTPFGPAACAFRTALRRHAHKELSRAIPPTRE